MSPSRPNLQPHIRALLIDISGTLLVGSTPTPGAAQALAKLRAECIPFRLCSNTSKESSDAVHKRMQAAGLDVRREEVWTSIGVLRALLKARGVKRPYMLLSPSALEECTNNATAEDGNSNGTSAVPDLPLSLPYDAVVVGLAPTLLDYAHLNTAFRILMREDQPRDTPASPNPSDPKSSSDIEAHPRPCPTLIALHKARYLEASDHALSLGPGPFVHALENATGASALVVGKPTRAFFEAVLRDLEHDLDSTQHRRDVISISPNSSDVLYDHAPGRVDRREGIAVIGDDVQADLGEGAIELGLWRVLVKTGKYRSGDEERTDAVPPDQVCASFSEFTEALLERRRAHRL